MKLKNLLTANILWDGEKVTVYRIEKVYGSDIDKHMVVYFIYKDKVNMCIHSGHKTEGLIDQIFKCVENS